MCLFIYICRYEFIYSICVQIHNFIGGCNYVCIFLNICTNTYEIAEHLKGSVSFDWMSCDSFRAETWAWEKVHKIANRLNHQRPPAHEQHRPWNPLIGMVASDMWKRVQLAQLCNPTAKGSSKVPGMFRFFRACIFVSLTPGPKHWNPTDSLLGICFGSIHLYNHSIKYWGFQLTSNPVLCSVIFHVLSIWLPFLGLKTNVIHSSIGPIFLSATNMQ